MKKIILILTLMIICSLSIFAIPQYNLFTGSITIDGSNVAVGTVLSATMGGTSAGSYTIETAGWYALAVTKPSGATTDAIIFNLDSVSGYDSINALTGNNYEMGKEDGTPIKLNLAFSGTPTAAAAPSPAAETPRRGGVMITPPEQPSTTETKVETATIPDVIASLPEGWTNVEASQITSAAETVKEALTTMINNALTHATQTEAVNALQGIQNKISSGEVSQIGIMKTLNVYKVNNKDTGENVYRSTITLTFTASNDMKNVNIIEVIPHAVVDSVEGLYFPGIKPDVLQKDPILQWTFETVKKDETKSVDYVIKKKIDKIESLTIAASEKAEEKKPWLVTAKTVIGIMIVVVIIIIGLAVYYYSLKKKKEVK